MLKHAADQVDTICACLQEERVSGSVINEFRNSLKDSDLAIHEKHLKELGAAGFRSAGNLHGTLPTAPTHGNSKSSSLSPIYQRNCLSPSSGTSVTAGLRHALKEKEECFDLVSAAVDYDWISHQNARRKALVTKLLRSPRPTSEGEKRVSLSSSDSNFDAFSEYNPQIEGLKQLYIPPPSIKVSRQGSNAISSNSVNSSPRIQSTLASLSSPKSPSRSATNFFTTGFDVSYGQKSVLFGCDR
jgi:hypothetical protein